MAARAARGKRVAGDHRLSFRAAKGGGMVGADGGQMGIRREPHVNHMGDGIRWESDI